jgi:methylase of polypeptide subunit release factors
MSPHETLVRLFHLETAVPEEAARQALAPMTLGDWIAAGLLAPPTPEGNVAPQVKLVPALGRVFASDKLRSEAICAHTDFVVPPGMTTLQLAHALINRPSRRTLDLGTGGGALACVAAAHSERVVATDISPRALEFARFNAGLNGVEKVEWLEGNWLEPVADRSFDLIVCNPPFVIAPTKRLLFRDSGMRGDEFCRGLARAVAERLEEGGYCQITCNYAHHQGQPWQDGLRAWFEGLGSDVVVWLLHTVDVSEYAMTWIISTESQDSDEVPRLYDQWMDYFEAEGIEAVSYLLVTMRRHEANTNWTRIEDFSRRIIGPCGEAVLRSFSRQDSLEARLDPTVMLDRRFRLVPEARIEQHHAMTGDGLAVTGTKLHLAGSVQHTIDLDGNVLGLIARCDGRTPLRELIGQLAAGHGLSLEKVSPSVLDVVRSLVDRGVLLPLGGEADAEG